MDVNTIGNFVLWAIAIVGLLGSAAVFLRGSADKGTITSLENSVAALKLEGEIKASKIQAQADEISTLRQQVVSMGRQIHTLQGVVTQAAEVARLQETLDAHHVEAREHWRAIEQALSRG